MSVCHAGPSGQALRTLSQCCGHSSDIPASQSEVCHHHHPYPNPTCLAGLSQPCVKASAESGAVRRGTERSL